MEKLLETEELREFEYLSERFKEKEADDVEQVRFFAEIFEDEWIKITIIRVDLIKKLVMKSFVPSRRGKTFRTVTYDEFDIGDEICKFVRKNLMNIKNLKSYSLKDISYLDSILNSIVIENGKLSILGIEELSKDKKFYIEKIIEIFEKRKNDKVYINEKDMFLEEYRDTIDLGKKWMKIKERDDLEGLRSTYIKNDVLIPMPECVRIKFLSCLNVYRNTATHYSFFSMKMIAEVFDNYKDLYYQNEINAILNFLALEEIHGLYVMYGNDHFGKRENYILEKYKKIFADKFFKTLRKKANKIGRKMIPGKEKFPELFDYGQGNRSIENLDKREEFEIDSYKISETDNRMINFSIKLRDNEYGILYMGYRTFKLLNDDFIKDGDEILYRIKYLKDVSYTIDGVEYKIKTGKLGGYVSKKAFIFEDVIILPGAKVEEFAIIGAGAVIDKDVVVKRCTRIYKYNFKVDESNVGSFYNEAFTLSEEEIEFLEWGERVF